MSYKLKNTLALQNVLKKQVLLLKASANRNHAHKAIYKKKEA